MYSYRINNSYTVYVNWDYYNQARKITERCRKSKTAAAKPAVKKPDVIIPLSLGATVSSNKYGKGVLTSKERNGAFTVQFREKIIRFMYPAAFQYGGLVIV